ncbi:MAG TPA: DUF1653 domain-containing protein [Candidatus Eisenbacteria bacterium]|nr:DUF1653 domain-containing protein [Candidatus Eisenbacteria bacterium]
MTRLKLLGAVVAPGVYRHFKGQRYRVLGTVRHSETLEELVLYKALYRNKTSALWVRPVKMFLEHVVVDGERVPRFRKTGRKK